MSEDATVRDEVDEVDDLVKNQFDLYQYQVDCIDLYFLWSSDFLPILCPTMMAFLTGR